MTNSWNHPASYTSSSQNPPPPKSRLPAPAVSFTTTAPVHQSLIMEHFQLAYFSTTKMW